MLSFREPFGRMDPYRNYQFLVESQGVLIGGFSEVQGLSVETEFDEIREGGVNDHIHKLPKITKYPNLILKRGLTDIDTLWKWKQDVVEGKIKRSDIWIILLTPEGVPGWMWMAKEAYPAQWIGPDLNANNVGISIEILEFAHNGLAKYSCADSLRKARTL